MIKHRFIIIACFACLIPFGAFSEAPVVDEGENYALLDEQQVASEPPVVRTQSRDFGHDEETALANDNIETSSSKNNSANAPLLDKVQGLQQDIQELRGQLEVQAHDLKLLQQQQLAFYKDLDARLPNTPANVAQNTPTNELSIGPKVPPNAPTYSPSAKPQTTLITPAVNNPARGNPADEQISYLAAYELVKNKRFDDALGAMQTFVAQHPQSGYTANAEYWLGEIYMVKKSYIEAMQHFQIVLQQFPSSGKAAASQLKIGYALLAIGRKQDAIQLLQQVVKNYPNTNTAQLARAKLDTLHS